MVKPELVIFDCDGVLVDSEPIALRTDLSMLATLGLAMSEEEAIARFVGRSASVIEAFVETQLGDRLEPGWQAQFHQIEAEALRRELVPVDGVVDALDAISLPICVASSSTHESLRLKLALTGLLERFSGHIFSAEDVANGKPAPDLFLHAAAQMGVSPTACVVVEDSQFGVRAARAAGMRVLAFSGGLLGEGALAGERTTLFHDMRRLPRLLDELETGDRSRPRERQGRKALGGQ